MTMRGPFWAMTLLGLATLAGVAACSSSSSKAGDDGGLRPVDASGGDGEGSTPNDAGSGDTGPSGDGSFYSVIKLDNALCLPGPLPTNNGVANCRMLLADVDGGCSSPGLTPAPQADITAIDQRLAMSSLMPVSSLCVLAQLPPGMAQSDWCVNSSSAGWCYIDGSCFVDAGCAHDICASQGFSEEFLNYDAVWFACP